MGTIIFYQEHPTPIQSNNKTPMISFVNSSLEELKGGDYYRWDNIYKCKDYFKAQN